MSVIKSDTKVIFNGVVINLIVPLLEDENSKYYACFHDIASTVPIIYLENCTYDFQTNNYTLAYAGKSVVISATPTQGQLLYITQDGRSYLPIKDLVQFYGGTYTQVDAQTIGVTLNLT